MRTLCRAVTVRDGAKSEMCSVNLWTPLLRLGGPVITCATFALLVVALFPDPRAINTSPRSFQSCRELRWPRSCHIAHNPRSEVIANSSVTDRVRRICGLDMSPTLLPPKLGRLVFASVLAVVCSLAVDDLIIKVAISVYPSDRGFSHFRPFDYGSLTILGVVAASAFWPVALRISSSGRQLFFRVAIVASILLWIPDLWLLARHESVSAVGALMTMHLAIALITYGALTRIAVPLQLNSSEGVDHGQFFARSNTGIEGEEISQVGRDVRPSTVRRSIWILLLTATCVEFVVGVAALVMVPYGRPTAWIPATGQLIYLVHAVLGGSLAIGAFGILVTALKESRISRIGSIIGCLGVTMGAGGGMISVVHSLRLIGMALMLIGAALAFFGYLAPIIEPSHADDEQRS